MHRINPVACVLVAIASVQFGAAIAKGMFDEASPVTLAYLRVLISAVILLALSRPRLGGRSVADWAAALAFGLCLTGMNLTIYLSFARIPIGVAVTLEFLGPLIVAVIGSRRPLDLLWVALASTGVVLLGALPSGIDPIGAALALLAGALWAGYIVLAGQVGRRWEGVTGLGVGSGFGVIVLTGPAIAVAGGAIASPRVVAVMAAVAVLSSVIPYALELQARRSMAGATFGILMSLEPAAAALFAMLILQEWLGAAEWAAMGCVIVASAGAIGSGRSTHRRREGHGAQAERDPGATGA